MNAGLACVIGLALDRVFGEPPRFHPLVGFGVLAKKTEGMLRQKVAPSSEALRQRGMLATLALLAPAALAAAILSGSSVGLVFDLAALYLSLGLRSLGEHAGAVRSALEAEDLPAARTAIARMVSRDTTGMDRPAVVRGAVESVLENGCDAVFGALFWFAVAGGPGVVVYRLANTLDAMWGYRNSRYRQFGWAAARVDDVLNWIPARLTALTYAMLGDRENAFRAWREQAGAWESPNAGPVMAAGAGALGVTLGGAATYGGSVRARPTLGFGAGPESVDIDRALKMIATGAWVWAALVLIGASIV